MTNKYIKPTFYSSDLLHITSILFYDYYIFCLFRLPSDSGVNVDTQAYCGYTPLGIALNTEHKIICSLLPDISTDLDIKGFHRQTS